MRNGRLLIDMHVHLARYKIQSESTRRWFISLYPSEADYQAVCDAYAAPDDFCAMLAEKGVDYAVILAEDTPAVTGVAGNDMVAARHRPRRRRPAGFSPPAKSHTAPRRRPRPHRAGP